MARQDFFVDLPGTCQYFGNPPKVVPDAKHASEKQVGTSRRKPSGWVKPTAYHFSRNRYDRHEGVWSYEYSSGGPFVTQTSYVGVVGSSPQGRFNSLNTFNDLYQPAGIPNSWVDRAVQQARLNMKDQDINLGAAFGERNATARLLGDTATNLAKSFRDLRRGNWRQASRRLGITNPRQPRGSSATSKWLELQYGWQPLLSDIHGACDALAKRDKSDWRVTGKGSVKEPIVTARITGHERSSDYGFGTVQGERGVFVRIDAVPESDLLRSLSALGITNPAAVAWELVPFSFVVDWALPIGDWLSSLDAMLGYGPTSCSISKLERFGISHRLMDSQPSGGGWFHKYTRNGTGSRHFVRLDRTVSDSVPLPTLPRFQDPLSLGHMANGLSLLSQVFGGRR